MNRSLISSKHVRILSVLWSSSEQGLSFGEIKSETGLSTITTQKKLNDLIDDGFIEKERGKNGKYRFVDSSALDLFLRDAINSSQPPK